ARPRLHQPLLGWVLGAQAGRLERGDGPLGVGRPDHEVEVVRRLGPAARPAREASGEGERDVGVAESGGRALHRLRYVLEPRLIAHAPLSYPRAGFEKRVASGTYRAMT